MEKIDSPAWETKGGKPVFLINAGFFDPNNSMTTSFLTENGTITGDPRKNPHLTENENLQKYLPQIFNRTEFRTYLCRDAAGQFETRYDIAPHNAANPPTCLLKDAVGAGPQLLPVLTDVLEGFVDFNSAGKVTRDPIGVGAKNARSAVAIKENGDVILAMGAQNPAKPLQTGFSLADMMTLLKERGAIKAMALDGGSSSGFMYEGKPHYGKFTKEGLPVKRPVKSVLIVAPK